MLTLPSESVVDCCSTLGATDPFFDAAATTLHYPFHEIPEERYTEVFEQHKLGADSHIATTLQVDGDSSVFRGKLGDMLNAILGRQATKTELQVRSSSIATTSQHLLSACAAKGQLQQLCWHGAVYVLAGWQPVVSTDPTRATLYTVTDAKYRQPRAAVCCVATALCWQHTYLSQHTQQKLIQTWFCLQAWFTFTDFDRGCIMCRQEYEQAVQLLRQFSANPQQAKSYTSFDRWKADHRLHRRVEWDPQQALQEPVTAAQQVCTVHDFGLACICLALICGLEVQARGAVGPHC